MSTHSKWSETIPHIIYEAYPDHDLLPIEPPHAGETIGEFSARAENAADTLFLFVCREADDEIDVHEYLARLDRAMRDIQSIRDASRENTGAPSSRSRTAKQDVTIRLALDASGRRSGNVTSTLHTSEGDAEEFNAAMDAVESMVLAHACAGIDVTDHRYVEGLRTCIDACANNLVGGGA